MSIAEWTDKDYAQAAIDMLPDDPEMIGEFLAAQGITARGKNSPDTCPINRWVRKWIDGPCTTNRQVVHNGYQWMINLSPGARRFIDGFDTGMIRF